MRGSGRRGDDSAGRTMRGQLLYRKRQRAPNGAIGVFAYTFQPEDSFEFAAVRVAHRLLEEHSALLRGRLVYAPRNRALAVFEREKEQYAQAGIKSYSLEDLYGGIGYLPLNSTAGFGRLRILAAGQRPSAREVVLLTKLPPEMPRVAGVISSAMQTPLSHVNLRAVQDGVPNAYIQGADQDPKAQALLGKYVYYRVQADAYGLREASAAEVERHFETMRPKQVVQPPRDLSVRQIRSLKDLSFGDAKSVGVKAANLAVLSGIGLPKYMVPKGYALPFSFYHDFMEKNGLYDRARRMLASDDFARDAEARRAALAKLRKKIRAGKMPKKLGKALSELQERFDGQAIRCRSSTNNEDLPNFSGAGLYDSFTHRPQEGQLAKTVKQVYASLWNFRAFEERAFFRVDHLATAMGVLVHRNYDDERANGVAVTTDVVYSSGPEFHYLNTQVGEELVTNPTGDANPEEYLLSGYVYSNDRRVRDSNRVQPGTRLLSEIHLDDLRAALNEIHDAFRKLYAPDALRFAMEVEYKVTAEGEVAIKQARPWVFGG